MISTANDPVGHAIVPTLITEGGWPPASNEPATAGRVGLRVDLANVQSSGGISWDLRPWSSRGECISIDLGNGVSKRKGL